MSALAALCLLTLITAPGDPPQVRYVAKVVTKSWEPIALAEVQQMVESKALAVLTKPGTLRLAKSGYADLASGDYTLSIDGRFIEEAESFSVYLAFGKGKRDDLPSFIVADTTALGKLSRAQMQQKIEALSAQAGRRLVEVLAPRLEAVRLSLGPPPVEEPKLPVEWGKVEIPEIPSPTKAIRTLLDPRAPDHERQQALSQIEAQVFDQQAARNAVERCLLTDPLPDLRRRCGSALEAISRTHVPTQRVILAAMRKEIDGQVLATLAKLSTTFVGLSRQEALATWLELAASEATPSEAAREVANLLGSEDDVPNLDLAVAACLRQQSLVYGKKAACAQTLLPKVPPARRQSVAIPYLRTVRVFETGEDNVYRDVVEAVPGRGSGPIDAALADVFLEIAERPNAGRARRDALYQLWRHPAPTPQVIERLTRLLHDPTLAVDVVRTIQEALKRAPALTAMALGALSRARGSLSYLPPPNREDPTEAIDKAITALKKKASDK